MDKNVAVNQLKVLIEEGEAVLSTSHYSDGILGGPWVKTEVNAPWQTKASLLLHEILPSHQQKRIQLLEGELSDYTSDAKEWQALLKGALDAIEQGVLVLDEPAYEAVDDTIERILERFPEIVDSINRRHGKRPGFPIDDEYDVQDLLRSVCLAFFDDVRDEEPVPSFAGKSSRVDLFLKDEARFIEVKMTRDGLRDKQLGDQLSIDIPQYGEHPGCERLFCFVYDPGRFVSNPKGLARDLESIIPGFVSVVVAR